MRTYAERRFTDDPLCTTSAQFTLVRGSETEEPAPVSRPWGLRALSPSPAGEEVPALRFDHHIQMAVLPDGRAFIDLVSGEPTAKTSEPTDGEDPPSAEDWKNDFAPDDPACPF